MKKILTVLVAVFMVLTLAGCGSKTEDSSAGKVYYLNFKPEADEQWQDLAKAYTEETGVPVTVLTAASGEYEKTLKSEMANNWPARLKKHCRVNLFPGLNIIIKGDPLPHLLQTRAEVFLCQKSNKSFQCKNVTKLLETDDLGDTNT